MIAVSGGFSIITDRLKKELGLDLIFSNELIFKDGKLHDIDLRVTSDKSLLVRPFIKEFNIKKDEIVVVVDGANDLKLFDLASYTVGFCPVDMVKKKADDVIEIRNLSLLKDLLEKRFGRSILNTVQRKISWRLPVSKLEVIPISIPSEIKPNDNLIDIILSSLHKSDSLGIKIKNKDILVIAQKIISKQEGMFVELARVIPSKQALEIKKSVDKDPRLIELILQESRKIIKIFNKTMIVETNQGFICANAGIDQSNVSKNQDRVLLLPRNPDQTASRIRREIKRKTGKEIAVIISDTFGRPFRNGQTNVAIGVSGVKPIKSYIGKKDMYGNVLKVTEIAIADEIAGASELVMGKSNKIPAVIIRGFNFTIARKSNIKDLNRREKLDMFRR